MCLFSFCPLLFLWPSLSFVTLNPPRLYKVAPQPHPVKPLWSPHTSSRKALHSGVCGCVFVCVCVVTWGRDTVRLYSVIVTVLATLSPSRIDSTINGRGPVRLPVRWLPGCPGPAECAGSPLLFSLLFCRSHHCLPKPIVSRESGGVTSLPPTGQPRAGTETRVAGRAGAASRKGRGSWRGPSAYRRGGFARAPGVKAVAQYEPLKTFGIQGICLLEFPLWVHWLLHWVNVCWLLLKEAKL